MIIVNRGVALTRVLRFEGGRGTGVWVSPGSVITPFSPRLELVEGQKVGARIDRVAKDLGAAFLTLDNGLPAFLRLKQDDPPLAEGSRLVVSISRLPVGSKSAVVERRRAFADGHHDHTDPDYLAEKLRAITNGKQNIIAEDAQTSVYLQRACPELTRPAMDEPDPTGNMFVAAFKEALDGGLSPVVDLPDGARLIINETEALTAIDIDTHLARGASRTRLRARVNETALAEITRQLALRRSGGQIAIDFLPVPKPQRAGFTGLLEEKLGRFTGFTRAGWTPSGLYTFALPRTEQSLLETVTVPGNDTPVAGRRMNPNIMVALAVTELEDRLRLQPKGRLQLVIHAELTGLAKACAVWQEKLVDRFGPRFEIMTRPAAGTGCTFQLDEAP